MQLTGLGGCSLPASGVASDHVYNKHVAALAFGILLAHVSSSKQRMHFQFHVATKIKHKFVVV